MDNWDTNTYRYDLNPENAETQDLDNNRLHLSPQPVEGIGMAETPITSTVQPETGFVLVDTPAPEADFGAAAGTEHQAAAETEQQAAPAEPQVESWQQQPGVDYEPVTEADIFDEEEEGYNTFTDPYGMPMRPDGSSYYEAPNHSDDGYRSSASGASAGYGSTGSDYGSTTGSSYYDADREMPGAAARQEQPRYENPRYEEPQYERPRYQRPVYEQPQYQRPSYGAKAKPAPMQLTRRAFIVIILVAMLLTSAITVGGIALVGNTFGPADTAATNYTLTESKENLDIASVVEKSKDAVVSITTEGMSTDFWAQNYVTKGAGSGVIVQSDGYIVTCNHVIEDANKIEVTTADSKTYEAQVVGTDPDNDLAVIKIDAKNLHAVKYADSTKLEVGDRVVAIGNPLGQLSNTATTGIISALNRNLTIEGQKLNLLQTDASINPGNSGGALLDASGNLVGIVESKSAGSDVEGLGFAVPVNTVAKSVKEIIETGSVSEADKGSSDSKATNKVAIGIIISELSDDMAMMYGYPQGGVLITSVTSDEAREAGLQQGDMITSFDGKDISSNDDLHDLLSKHKAGDKVKLQVLRDGQTLTITTKLVQASN